MSVEQIIQVVPAAYVLVFFRIAGMMIFAPLLGSNLIPKRVKALLAAIISLGICQAVPLPVIPHTIWELTVGIGGEIVFGVAMGTVLSFVFIAAQWAGEMIGQQMGLNMSEVIDPQFGQSSSLIGDVYFWLTLVVFLVIGGHRAMLIGVRASFDSLPLLSVGVTKSLVELIVGLFQSATVLALQLAAPMLVTMLIVDLALGFVSKTIPQLNVMTAGLSMRGIIGMIVLIFGVTLTNDVLRRSLWDAMYVARDAWTGGLR